MTCRFCKLSDYDSGNNYPMVMYAARHHAHADCGLEKLGVGFLIKLRQHGYRLNKFPALAAYRANLWQELVQLASEQDAALAERDRKWKEAQERHA